MSFIVEISLALLVVFIFFFMQIFYTFYYLVAMPSNWALRLFKGKFFCPLSFLGKVYFAIPILYSETSTVDFISI
jgi:hypothetical protein